MCVPHLATILCRTYPLPVAPCSLLLARCPLPFAPLFLPLAPLLLYHLALPFALIAPLLLVVYLQLLYVSECGLEHRLATLYAAIGIIAYAV